MGEVEIRGILSFGFAQDGLTALNDDQIQRPRLRVAFVVRDFR
jgi:hypothetical protein